MSETKKVQMTESEKSMKRAEELQKKIKAMYGENKKITDGNYDRSLAVKCVNGTFVGKKSDSFLVYKGIPFVGAQLVGDLRWKAPVDYTADDSIYEAYYNGKSACQLKSGSEVSSPGAVIPRLQPRFPRTERKRNGLPMTQRTST